MAPYLRVLYFGLNVLAVCWTVSMACPVLADNPYRSILQRNVFGLRPHPPMASEPLHAPIPKVHLTGIATILKGKRALLKVEFPTKPPERPKEESLILKEGQRAGPIEVLEINEKTDQVKVNNSGTITNLTFEKLAPTPQPPIPPVPVPRWNRMPYRPIYR
jgi:hypothetical protein